MYKSSSVHRPFLLYFAVLIFSVKKETSNKVSKHMAVMPWTLWLVYTPNKTVLSCLDPVLMSLDPVSNLQLIACSHRRRGPSDKTVLSRPCRRCEQAITLITLLHVFYPDVCMEQTPKVLRDTKRQNHCRTNPSTIPLKCALGVARDSNMGLLAGLRLGVGGVALCTVHINNVQLCSTVWIKIWGDLQAVDYD